MTTYFTKDEALNTVLDLVKDGYEGDVYDLINEAFNTDYYIIGTANAEKALEQYGVFQAIRKIREYEEENFGENFTKIEDPEKVANMLYYIVGNDVTSEALSEFDAIDDENREENLQAEEDDLPTLAYYADRTADAHRW